MRRYIIEVIAFLGLLLLPFLLLAIMYLHFDPFQVVNNYSEYSFMPIDLNRDYITTEIFLANKNHNEYNSFIIGSSRATAFDPNTWRSYLELPAIPYSFDAGNIYGIYTKLRFLEREEIDIDNVLILLCRNAFYKYENSDHHLGIGHPKVTGQSWIKFHFTFFKAYFNLKFLLGYYSYVFTNGQNMLTSGIIQDREIMVDYSTGHYVLVSWEKELSLDRRQYYESRRNIFYEREGERLETEQKLNEESLTMLMEIKEILKRNHTNYKVVLSPIYDQIRFSPQDKKILMDFFGDHLYDFTGENYITENDTNWYEAWHFRPFIADSIMKIVYSVNSDSIKWR